MDVEILQKIGLSNGEVTIYSALLNSGSSPVSKIHEATGIERRNIYDILTKLIEKGLVTFITENKRKTYRISHPNKLLGYVNEQKETLNTINNALTAALPPLIKKFNAKDQDIGGEIFRGQEGVKAVWEDMLNYNINYWLGSGRYVPKKLPHFFVHWNRRRMERKIKWRNLVRKELRSKIRKPMRYEQIKYLPKQFSGNPTAVCIYGNKIANFLLGDIFFAFVIESKDLAENYRKYHKYLWENVAKE